MVIGFRSVSTIGANITGRLFYPPKPNRFVNKCASVRLKLQRRPEAFVAIEAPPEFPFDRHLANAARSVHARNSGRPNTSGRKSYAVTSPLVACSIFRQCFAGTPLPCHCWTAECETPHKRAISDMLPIRFAALVN